MEYPLLSVIVPVYKVEKYLDRCLRSITEQTYRNLEILLVDDGSPDGSGAICDAWAAKDSRIRVIHQRNAGAGAARNAALDLARGELIGFVDSDDYIEPHMYEHLYSLMGEDVDIVECEYLSTEDDHVTFPSNAGKVFSYTPEEAMLCHVQDTIFRQLIWNKLYRRNMVENIRFPVGTKIDDEYFTYRVLARARNLLHSDRICYAYRQQESSIMHNLRSPQKYNAIQAKLQRLDYLNERMPGLVYEAKADLLLTCVFAMQDCVQYLSGQELEEARSFLQGVRDSLMPLKIPQKESPKRKILLYIAMHSLETTAKVLNFLIKVHILT